MAVQALAKVGAIPQQIGADPLVVPVKPPDPAATFERGTRLSLTPAVMRPALAAPGTALAPLTPEQLDSLADAIDDGDPKAAALGTAKTIDGTTIPTLKALYAEQSASVLTDMRYYQLNRKISDTVNGETVYGRSFISKGQGLDTVANELSSQAWQRVAKAALAAHGQLFFDPVFASQSHVEWFSGVQDKLHGARIMNAAQADELVSDAASSMNAKDIYRVVAHEQPANTPGNPYYATANFGRGLVRDVLAKRTSHRISDTQLAAVLRGPPNQIEKRLNLSPAELATVQNAYRDVGHQIVGAYAQGLESYFTRTA